MDQSRWKKIESILDEALIFTDQQEQDAFIKKACAADQDLYKQISVLLIAIREAKATNFLEKH